MIPKPFYRSKTLWINLLVIPLTWLLAHQGVLPAAGLSTPVCITILGFANMVLRWVTTKPLTLG